MSAPAFPEPHHDHDRCTTDAIAHAERVCAEKGERLTPMRRLVLERLLASHRPLGAYDVIEQVAQLQTRPAPVTIYRALDFLTGMGFAHRIRSRNAFIACVHTHAAGDRVMFMICEHCGAVGEASSPAITRSIDAAAAEAGFVPSAPVLEIAGLCGHCAREGHAP